MKQKIILTSHFFNQIKFRTTKFCFKGSTSNINIETKKIHINSHTQYKNILKNRIFQKNSNHHRYLNRVETSRASSLRFTPPLNVAASIRSSLNAHSRELIT